MLGELLSGFAIGTCAEANRQELQRFLTSERVHQLVIDAAEFFDLTGGINP